MEELETEKTQIDVSLMFAVPASIEAHLLLYKIRIQYRKDQFHERMKFKISGQERIFEGMNIYDLTLHLFQNSV